MLLEQLAISAQRCDHHACCRLTPNVFQEHASETPQNLEAFAFHNLSCVLRQISLGRACPLKVTACGGLSDVKPTSNIPQAVSVSFELENLFPSLNKR
ncbi:hypothetical protein [Synechococcus sp. MIT S9509]|uniref:hypothetical protein n=1 Tax=Synechococcus sp. MIT S9509 TaxID=1801630 RepID=UPI0009412BDE|nr:hypothetical protein [Synechococcus sp. MIT S9509]